MYSFEDLLPTNNQAIGIYIHVPFCKIRCSYCDFATDLERVGERDQYFKSLEVELNARILRSGLVVDTLYLGGGTPSLLTVTELKRLKELLKRYFDFSGLKEFTIEANPSCVNSAILKEWAKIGINRVSLGVQSFIGSELKVLGRAHLVEDNHIALKALSQSGLRFNADLMIGTPGQTLASVEKNLNTLIDYGVKHISIYMLSVEPDAPWFNSVQNGKIKVCDDEDVAKMYKLVIKKVCIKRN